MTAHHRSGHEHASNTDRLRLALICLAAGFLLPSHLLAAAKQKSSGGHPPAARAANRASSPSPGGQPHPGDPVLHPGERALERLENMTPEQRAKALQNLPLQRRQEIEQKLEVYDRLSPSERVRLRNQAERLASLPPQRQNQVRRSMQQFQNLPDDRKMMVKRELDRMTGMPDEARRSYMNTEEFRNRYTPVEQQMMQNLSQIMPENRDSKD